MRFKDSNSQSQEISNGRDIGTGLDKRQQELLRISRAMVNFNYDQNYSDVYLAIHQHLLQELPGYHLAQIMDAALLLMEKGEILLAPPSESLTINHAGQRLTYQRRIYESGSR